MEDKERLEGIKNRVLINQDGITDELISYELSPEDYWELVRQAERVEELETLVQKLDEQRQKMGGSHQETIRDCGKLLEQNQRYREALEFYADKKTYQLGVNISMGAAHPRHEPIKYDSGEKARQALDGDHQ
ncbi:hypothetical protein ACTWQB_11410 [Piscibacillus sp. B03]|uniref:hypothetical protein n=1 Tax=Piscibacillus sp. B03 TaxID=3457430 RepID=UPI003FCD886B